jgi:hypothetical protein
MSNFDLDKLAAYGVSLDGARGILRRDRSNLHALVQDAALQTAPSSSVPAELRLYLAAEVVDVLTAPRTATELLKETRPAGLDETTSYIKYRIAEAVGRAVPYSDYGEHGTADVNSEYRHVEQHVFQTTVTYGHMETAVANLARINLVAEKQAAAARVLAIESNRVYMYGVEGRAIYGILNDPNLPAAVTPIAAPRAGGADAVGWRGKTTEEIYNDVRKLFGQLTGATAGLVNQKSELVLAVSPEMSVSLGTANQYNISPQDMLNKYFSSLRVVVVPELTGSGGEERIFLFTPVLEGQSAGDLVYGQKFKALQVIPQVSSYKQKVYASSCGAVIRYPMAFAIMTGLEAA